MKIAHSLRRRIVRWLLPEIHKQSLKAKSRSSLVIR